ncbi:hypothetical protein HGRIS_001355 [Hohenbuehelia grisea]|uniref:Uncharacterized protein n=1 Tax=Hohenbuehelia grisea TaxID=104357 RepID=A0ABR3JQ44_9AGAR
MRMKTKARTSVPTSSGSKPRTRSFHGHNDDDKEVVVMSARTETVAPIQIFGTLPLALVTLTDMGAITATRMMKNKSPLRGDMDTASL